MNEQRAAEIQQVAIYTGLFIFGVVSLAQLYDRIYGWLDFPIAVAAGLAVYALAYGVLFLLHSSLFRQMPVPVVPEPSYMKPAVISLDIDEDEPEPGNEAAVHLHRLMSRLLDRNRIRAGNRIVSLVDERNRPLVALEALANVAVARRAGELPAVSARALDGIPGLSRYDETAGKMVDWLVDNGLAERASDRHPAEWTALADELFPPPPAAGNGRNGVVALEVGHQPPPRHHHATGR